MLDTEHQCGCTRRDVVRAGSALAVADLAGLSLSGTAQAAAAANAETDAASADPVGVRTMAVRLTVNGHDHRLRFKCVRPVSGC